MAINVALWRRVIYDGELEGFSLYGGNYYEVFDNYLKEYNHDDGSVLSTLVETLVRSCIRVRKGIIHI